MMSPNKYNRYEREEVLTPAFEDEVNGGNFSFRNSKTVTSMQNKNMLSNST